MNQFQVPSNQTTIEVALQPSHLFENATRPADTNEPLGQHRQSKTSSVGEKRSIEPDYNEKYSGHNHSLFGSIQ